MGLGGASTAATPLLPGGGAAAGGGDARERALRLVIGAAGLYVLAVAVIVPVKPALMLSACGGDSGRAALFSGAVDASQSLLSVVTAPVLGALSDALGRVPVLQGSAAVEAAGLLCVAAAARWLPGQFLAYMLIATANAFSMTVAACIADLCPEPDRATAAYGLFGAAIGLAFMLGPAVGGWISGAGDTVPFVAAAALLTGVIIFVSRWVPETGPAADAALSDQRGWWARARESASAVEVENPVPQIHRVLFQCPALGRLTAAVMVSSLAESGLISIMFLYVNARFAWGAAEVGNFVSALGLVVLVAQGLLAPLLVRAFGERAVIVGGYLCSSLHFALYGLARDSWGMYAGLCASIPGIAAGPVTKAVLARQVSKEKQGELQGSLSALNSLAKPISTIGCAALFAVGNANGMPQAVFFVITGFSLCAAVLANLGLVHPELK